MKNFLLTFIPAMEEGLTLGVPTVILSVILLRLGHEDYVKNFRTAIKWGFWLSVFLIAVRVGTRNAVSREFVEGAATFITLFSEVTLILRLFRNSDAVDKLLKISIIAFAVTMFLYHGFEIWLLPAGAVSAALGNYRDEVFLTKIAGFAFGILFAILSSFLVGKAAAALNNKRLKFVFLIQLAACMLQQTIFLIQVLMARGILSGEKWMELMAPVINHSSQLIFVIFAALLVLPITLFSQPKPERKEEYNPAQYRKVLASAIHKRRWGAAVIVSLLIMTTASSAGSYIANKQEEIVPAIPVTAEAGTADVELEKINDGHLHRFVYHASTGEDVRYIVILKGGSSYGVGLDACEICGATGYYERDNQVICKLCDVQMNKATIGTRGGCNPIPVSYVIEEGKLKIPQAELEENAKIFR